MIKNQSKINAERPYLKLIKVTYDKPTDTKSIKPEIILFKIGKVREGCLLYPLLFNRVLKLQPQQSGKKKK